VVISFNNDSRANMVGARLPVDGRVMVMCDISTSGGHILLSLLPLVSIYTVLLDAVGFCLQAL